MAGEDGPVLFTGERAYIDIIIREAGHIVGCAAIEIAAVDAGSGAGQTYGAELLRSLSFPRRADGSYQPVTEEDAAAILRQIRQAALQDEASVGGENLAGDEGGAVVR